MRVRVWVVVALAVTAGCGGVTSDAETAGTVPPQLAGTPSATPSPTATPVGASVPGVSATGVDANRLSAVHDRQLRVRSRTVRRVAVVRDANGTLVGRNTAVIRATSEREETVRVRGTTAGTDPASVGLSAAWIDYWTNGTAAASKRTVNGSVTYQYQGGPLPPGSGADTTGLSLVAFAFGVVDDPRVERGDDGTIRLTARRNTSDELRDVRLRATLTTEGIVRELRIAYNRTMDGRELRVVRRFAVSDLGTTIVRSPSWLSAARNASDDTGPSGDPNETDAATTEPTTTAPNASTRTRGGKSKPDETALAPVGAARGSVAVAWKAQSVAVAWKAQSVAVAWKAQSVAVARADGGGATVRLNSAGGEG